MPSSWLTSALSQGNHSLRKYWRINKEINFLAKQDVQLPYQVTFHNAEFTGSLRGIDRAVLGTPKESAAGTSITGLNKICATFHPQLKPNNKQATWRRLGRGFAVGVSPETAYNVCGYVLTAAYCSLWLCKFVKQNKTTTPTGPTALVTERRTPTHAAALTNPVSDWNGLGGKLVCLHSCSLYPDR